MVIHTAGGAVLRKSIINGIVVAVAASLLVGAAPASAAIAPGSCVWQTAAGISAASGPSSYVVIGADGSVGASTEAMTPCSAPLVQPLADFTGVSSPFGMRIHPITGAQSMHYGTDYARSGIRGAAIKSIAAGTVYSKAESYATTGAGNTVVIAHANGVRSQYMHMGASTSLPIGARVEAGQVIGNVGSTGGSTGPHLHLEVRVNGTLTNPFPYLADAPFLR